MLSISLIIEILWAIFWIYWLFKALNSKQNVGFKLSKSFGFRLIILIFAVVIFRLINHSLLNYNYSNFNEVNIVFKLIGLVVFILGLSLAVWARVYLGRNWGTPMSKKKNPELVTSGPYRLIRHPIYTGIIAGLLGTAIAVNISWLFLFAVAAIYFFYSAKKEEQYLLKIFRKTYLDYMKTSKMLIPFVL